MAFDVVQRYVQCAPQVGRAIAMETRILSSNQGRVVNSLLGVDTKVGPGSLVLNCDIKVRCEELWGRGMCV